MRIRSIKPEFWRSPDITLLDRELRLLFIGLWSYVDDNGVGQDRVSTIAADLFADDLSRDPRETLAWITGGLAKLSEVGRIVRYTVASRDFLLITNWDKHQRIDKPNKPRYPLPTSDDAFIRETLAESSRDPRDIPAPGTEEQGNRGTGENPPTPHAISRNLPAVPGKRRAEGLAAINATAHSPQAHKIAVAYTGWLETPVDGKTLTEIAVAVDTLLDADIDPHQIAEGIKAWHASDSWSPTQIRRFVHKASTGPKVGKPTKKAQTYADAAEQLLAEVRTIA